ncbi:gas vesicle protein [Streptomyces violaceusniger]|uniref:Gas vesicle protein GVPa n=1 Tax=Streptomyces violaceusniger (strain Tu 4113) TaxID=653045 RepID=G2PAD6_STRV4|nr:gas vesicle protein [Streptomyces violaceusniger]AEM80945.1 gas vesicle protein GVPa [Streptomyces violaceusniger Tu 4113]
MTERDLACTPPPTTGPPSSDLAEILERVLDKGIVIAGDIKIDLLDIELLTIRLRLFISSVDTARKAGIDWWETDPALSSRAAKDALAQENAELRERLHALESRMDSDELSAVGATAGEKGAGT